MRFVVVLLLLAFAALCFASGATMKHREVIDELAAGGVTILGQVCKPDMPWLSSVADAVANGVASALGSAAGKALLDAALHASSTQKPRKIEGGGAANTIASDPDQEECVKLAGLKSGTVDGLVALKKASQCEIVLQRAVSEDQTETEFGFANGYRVEILKNDCVTRYIKATYKHRNSVYENADGDVFTEKPASWEILFY